MASRDFDPYHEWLGIPASEQPPHHYRLLGIPAFEESPKAIQNAADRQMVYLRTFQIGQHSALSQKLLNEVASAKVCLLSPAKKAVYDEQLRQHLEPISRVSPPATDSLPQPTFDEMLDTASQTPARGVSRSRKNTSQKSLGPIVTTVVVAVVAVLALGVWWSTGGGENAQETAAKGEHPKPQAAPKRNAILPPKPRDAKVAKPSARPELPPVEHSTPQKEPKAEAVAQQEGTADTSQPTKTLPDDSIKTDPAEAKPGSQDSTTEKPDKEKAPAKNLDPPSADEQKRLLHETDEVYKPGEAKDQTAKAALARKLLEDGRKSETSRGEQFVLLRRAGEIACDAGEPDVLLEAVDAMTAAGFNIQPFQIKSRLLKRLVEQGLSGDGSQLSTVSTACLKFAEEAAASGAIEEAVEVLDSAQKSLAEPRKRAQQAWSSARAAAARIRNPADKAAREQKAREANDELEAIKAAQSALAECAKGLQQARHEIEAIQVAREKLKTDSNDPDACLTVGRWRCFNQGDWDEGLKLLAKGSDDALRSLATEELAAKPSKVEDKVARGDAWWDLAEKAAGRPKAVMRRRAASWYQEAMPDLAPGLGKSKAEKRLAQTAEEPLPEADGRATRIRPPLAVAPFDEKTAKMHQARWSKYLGVPVVQTNSIDMKLALIPPGEFQMGSPKELIEEELKAHAGDPWWMEHLPGEAPQHRVRITKPYWLGVTEVTQEEYQRVMGKNPSQFQGDPKRPVEQVSWDDAVEFCRRLSELPEEKAAKRRYGLPTEAEWEHACRAGSAGRWCFSPQRNPLPGGVEEKTLGEYGWFSANAGSQTHPVGQKRANTFGLYDMSGNVWEWCQDWYGVGYYTQSPMDNPTGSTSGSGHVRRGGGWFGPAGHGRSAIRSSAVGRGGDLGFRVRVLSDRSGERTKPERR